MHVSSLDSEYEVKKSVLASKNQRVVWLTGSELSLMALAEAEVVVRPLTPAERWQERENSSAIGAF